tara:strand:+ start:364 stop:600 length:237 start_codon:yes stop_codon:yes gene_type:complete
MEWLQSNWAWFLGAFAVIGGGFYIPFMRSMIFSGFKAMVSEAVLKKAAMQMVEKLVKSSKNKLDDVWFQEFKKKVEKS